MAYRRVRRAARSNVRIPAPVFALAAVAAVFLAVTVGGAPGAGGLAGRALAVGPAAPAGQAPGADAEARVPLTVLTFNIRTSGGNDGENGWVHRRALVADTFGRLAPDVAGLQEALDEQVEWLAGALPGYRWLGVDRGLNGGTGLSEYTPIFYRPSVLIPIESGNFWLSSDPDGPTGSGWRRNVSRIVTWAHFHHRGTGRRVHVFNTHLTLRRGQRQVDSAAMIASRVAALPPGSAVIVTGDFNAMAEASETWRAATGQGLKDAWVVAGERLGPARTSSDFRPPDRANEGRIDWILVGGPISIRSVETIIDHDAGRYPSDHYPVVAQLDLRP